MTDQEFALAAERYMDTIFRVAYSYLRSKSDADDVTQDVLISLSKNASSRYARAGVLVVSKKK